MDEILIEEKKYISSKRAAKITGYAKDYVGQLCREGRVPARLVGRSWYVLETAIQDHRFGDNQAKQDIKISTDTPEEKFPTKESPHYEASPVETLPSVNRLRSTELSTSENVQEESSREPELLQDSWRAWFDHVGATKQVATTTPKDLNKEKEESKDTTEAVKEGGESEVEVPVHIVYEPLPKELLPIGAKEFSAAEDLVRSSHKIIGTSVLVRLSYIAGPLCIAAIFIVLAVIGSGYFDNYLVSIRQADVISGMIIYKK